MPYPILKILVEPFGKEKDIHEVFIECRVRLDDWARTLTAPSRQLVGKLRTNLEYCLMEYEHLAAGGCFTHTIPTHSYNIVNDISRGDKILLKSGEYLTFYQKGVFLVNNNGNYRIR